MTLKFNFSFLFVLMVTASTFAQQWASPLKANFQNGLIYAQIPTASGSINMMANTSGGAYLLESTVDDYGLQSVKNNDGTEFVKLDALLKEAGLPTTQREMTLVVNDKESSLQPGIHGELGQSWFANHVWKFDYENQELVYNEFSLASGDASTVQIAFKENDRGERMSNLPLAFASIEGVDIPFIIDTGAKMEPTAEASAALGTYTEEPVAMSFIIDFIFEHWKTIHPEWQVVETADAEMGNVSMIQVPEITIAGVTVGPVWFASRPDINYLEYMARFTNIPAMGSLGGNFLSNFNLTIDYPNKLAKFGLPNPE